MQIINTDTNTSDIKNAIKNIKKLKIELHDMRKLIKNTLMDDRIILSNESGSELIQPMVIHDIELLSEVSGKYKNETEFVGDAIKNLSKALSCLSEFKINKKRKRVDESSDEEFLSDNQKSEENFVVNSESYTNKLDEESMQNSVKKLKVTITDFNKEEDSFSDIEVCSPLNIDEINWNVNSIKLEDGLGIGGECDGYDNRLILTYGDGILDPTFNCVSNLSFTEQLQQKAEFFQNLPPSEGVSMDHNENRSKDSTNIHEW